GVFDEDSGSGDGFPFHGGGGGSRCFGSDFVATDVGKADRFEDMDAVDDPANLRFPVNRFQNTPRGAGSDDIVGDALDLHLGPGEAGEVAADAKLDAVGHWMRQ